IPGYIGAYALTDFLEYAGPVQTALRDLFGWQTSRDYWFPEVRSRWAAVLVLSASLYPYVYLLSRAAFREMSGVSFEVARALGSGQWGVFFRVALPMARPAIAAGTAIVMMETVADFGVVEFFAVQTLTTGIFTTWLEAGNAAGAAQIALVSLTLVLSLIWLERVSRRRAQSFGSARQHAVHEQTQLSGWKAGLASFVCFVPFTLGFLLPGGVILKLALNNAEEWLNPDLIEAMWNTVKVASIAAVITVSAGLIMVYGIRISRNPALRALLPLTALGYAAPGAVLGLGLLIPLGAFDNALADGILAVTGHDIGLLMTGSAGAVILAYVARFFTIAQGSADAAMGRISPSLPMAARSLGRDAKGTLSAVHMPMMRGSIAMALLLVFVDSVKELPATLLLRPFNFETLATRVYGQASLERIGDAAPPALLVSFVGLCAVILLAKTGADAS
ncbi:MAG: ABC transporter permease, partial [Mangrovicoccus sp.]